MLYIFVTSRHSASVISGRIVGILCAIIVFPHPGSPIISILCPPAAANMTASINSFCPFTSAKSTTFSQSSCSILSDIRFTSTFFPSKKRTTSLKFCSPIIVTPWTSLASFKFSTGMMTFFIPLRCAAIIIGRIP